MIKPKIDRDYRVSWNFYDFYLLKWGIKKKIQLSLNTRPDNFALEMERDFLKNNKSLIKLIFDMVRSFRLEYYKSSDEFVVYSKDKKKN